MSYLFPLTSKTEQGVVKVGDNIYVDLLGTISIPQDVSPDATITFDTVNVTTSLVLDGKEVITQVDASAGPGISLTSVDSTGPTVAFTINNTGVLSITTGTGLSVNTSATGDVSITNTGVLSLTAGNGIALSGSTGNITVSATESGTIPTYEATSNYTATDADEYIGVTSAGVVITLPSGVDGKTYVIKNEGAGGNISVVGTSENLDGAPSKTLGNNASITVIFRGSQWHIV